MPGRTPDTRRSAARRGALRGRLPLPGDCPLAGQGQARHRGDRDDVAHGLVADIRGLAGLKPPPHIWKDNNGKPIVFDGIDNSDYLLGKGPSKRDHVLLLRPVVRRGAGQEVQVPVHHQGRLVGTEPSGDRPAMYNLQWDPGEQYDILFNGAAPTQGDLKTSPGRFAGADHGWTLTGYMTPASFPTSRRSRNTRTRRAC